MHNATNTRKAVFPSFQSPTSKLN